MLADMACGHVCARLDFIMKKMDLSKNMTDSSKGSLNKPQESQKAVYEKDCEDCKKQLDAADTACRRITFWRGMASLAVLVLSGTGYSRKSAVLCALSAAALAVFLMLVRRHQKLREHQAWLDDRYCVTRDYLARFGDAWKQFPLNGEAYLTEDFTEAMDLDIFGRSSLYQYICTASTCYGQDRLAHWLCCPFGHPSKTLEQMSARQDAVAELAAKPDFSMDFETAARRLRHENGTAVRQAVDDLSGTACNAGLHDSIRRTAVWLFPGITLALLLAALTGMQDGLFWTYFSIAASIQLFSCMAGFQRNQKLLAPVYRLNKAITPYAKLLPALEQESFESPYLKELQKSLLQNGTSASAAFRELSGISQAVMTRKNIFAFVLYGSLFLYDYRCVERYLKWKRRYGQELRPWLEAVGKAEALISLGVLSRTRSTCTLPRIAASPSPQFCAVSLRHPLLPESKAVGNDFEFRYRTCIITGSNMSGKTTFMRSIGVNLILAYAGGFCTARSLSVSPMELHTSMRVQDNVNEGISTFYAELLRIRRMIDASTKQVPMLALIDEIYKGTNAKDRIFAAAQTVKKLSQPHIVTILTTHDFELCDLEDSGEMDAENYYFAEKYENDRILFDYQIKKGRAVTANARYLLRMAGIL